MRRRAFLLAAGLLAAMLVPTGLAQTPYTISGQILDQDGQPVADAQVWLYQYGEVSAACDDAGDCREVPEGEGTYHEASTRSDADGRFSLAAHAGWASISIQKDGHAGHHDSLEVTGDHALDVELLRYPGKTAHVQGRISAPGAAYYSLSIQHPEYGIHACSSMAGQDGSDGVRPLPATEPDDAAAGDGASDAGGDGTEPAASNATVIAPRDPYGGCDITIQDDGSFSGNVTPGYGIIRAHADAWQAGGPGYYSHVVVRDLPADATTALDIRLQARPGPDATLKGYVVDASGDVVGGAQISFHNQDAYGWADAQTDGDGSYQVRLRSGFTGLSVWADGYLPWEGQVQVAPGDDMRFDIRLTAGTARYGGCCWLAADGAAGAAEDNDAEGAPGAVATADRSGGGDEAAGSGFEDLGGGLGPYAPAEQDAAAPVSVPGFEVVAVALGLLAVILLRRR